MPMIEFFESASCPVCARVRSELLPTLMTKFKIVTYDIGLQYSDDSVRSWKQVCAGQVPAIRIVPQIPVWMVGFKMIEKFTKEIYKEINQTRQLVFPSITVV